MEKMLRSVKKLIPRKLFRVLQPAYHYLLALAGAVLYRFPSRALAVVMVTGTKGKSSVVELLSAILEEAGFKTAALSTIRFKIGAQSEPNRYKMTTPGRFFVERFLRQAVNAGCHYAVLEMTSEAARQFRHKFIYFDALIFTNLSPEHIESHGSYEKYVAAKLSIGRALEKSRKKKRALVVNADDPESKKFLALRVPEKLTYSLADAAPYALGNGSGVSFTFGGETIHPRLEGVFNIYNCMAAATFAKNRGITTDAIKRGLENVALIRGRVEHIDCGQPFTVIVDYAHTPDSLEKLYQAFPNRKKIAVLGNTGGGRDGWKRPEMGKIADEYCHSVILTNEDPYDEDPDLIVKMMAMGMRKHQPKIIMDRRKAIAAALQSAAAGDIVLITGKGTDPFIMGARGFKLPWDDATVVREELKKII